jgi:ABC-type multidrug transport system fused ATPase/permease subunit
MSGQEATRGPRGVIGDFLEQLRPRTAPGTDPAQLLDQHTDIDARETLRVLGRGLRYVAPFWPRFLAKTLFAMVSLMPSLLFPWTLSIIIDHVIRAEPVGEGAARYPEFIMPLVALMVSMPPAEILFWVIVASLVLVAIVGGFATGAAANDNANVTMASGYDTAVIQENIANTAFSSAGGLYGFVEFRWQLRLSQALNHYYRSQIYQRIKSLPMALLDNQRIGDTIYRVVYDTPAITSLCYNIATRPWVGLSNITLILYIMGSTFSTLPWLPWLAFAAFPVQLAITLPFARLVRRRQNMSRVAGAATTATMEEGMHNMLAVQSLGGERRQQALFEHRSRESFRRYRGVMGTNALIAAVASAVTLAFSLTSGYLIIDSIIAGDITPGNYAVLTFYFGWLSGAIGGLARIWIDMQDNAMGVRRVFALLDVPGEDDSGETLPPVREGLRVEHVDFVYPDGRQALGDVSFEGRIGELVAIVGGTGAGKTTLASLVPRYHAPTRGRVLIDGHDIAGVSLSSLRSQVAYVFQETHLFSGTIADNIRYGNPGATLDAVRAAARIAGADDFIMALPAGYDTPVGRSGSTLSVGQKQRIALARALLVEAPILILDEPTSALDPETEARLVATIEEAARDRLVIVIAHRLSTIRTADRIVLLEAGRVVDVGRHDELMARADGAYHRFVNHEAGTPPAASS